MKNFLQAGLFFTTFFQYLTLALSTSFKNTIWEKSVYIKQNLTRWLKISIRYLFHLWFLYMVQVEISDDKSEQDGAQWPEWYHILCIQQVAHNICYYKSDKNSHQYWNGCLMFLNDLNRLKNKSTWFIRCIINFYFSLANLNLPHTHWNFVWFANLMLRKSHSHQSLYTSVLLKIKVN